MEGWSLHLSLNSSPERYNRAFGPSWIHGWPIIGPICASLHLLSTPPPLGHFSGSCRASGENFRHDRSAEWESQLPRRSPCFPVSLLPPIVRSLAASFIEPWTPADSLLFPFGASFSRETGGEWRRQDILLLLFGWYSGEGSEEDSGITRDPPGPRLLRRPQRQARWARGIQVLFHER